MTPQEIQIAVAEEMGLFGFEVRNKKLTAWTEIEKPGIEVPPYTTSIDAIREACLERFKTHEAVSYFHSTLISAVYRSDKYCWQLTALDWCEAFLTTCKELKK
jgi:GTP1/Obg family GTP-binding protein